MALSRRIRRGGPLGRVVLVGLLPLLSGCTASSLPLRATPGPSSGIAAKELLPADLDIVLWLDVSRTKQYFRRNSERALLGVLVDYGLLPARSTESDLSFLLQALGQTERLWLACRPHAKNCEDPVVLLRGKFARFEPQQLPHLTLTADLGGGWLRYDRDKPRTGSPGRSAISRVYFAPPDRLLLVSYTELDAVERALERHRGTRTQIPTETGLLSVQMRPQTIADLIQERAPSAARWIRDAASMELVVSPRESALLLEATMTFDSSERAERAGTAARIVAGAFAKHDANSPMAQSHIEVLDQRLVVRFALRPPDAAPVVQPDAQTKAPSNEP